MVNVGTALMIMRCLKQKYINKILSFRPSNIAEVGDIIQQKNSRLNASRPYDLRDQIDDAEKGGLSADNLPRTYLANSLEKQREPAVETPRLSIFGVAKIRRTRLLASLSGLKLEAEIINLQASSSFKKKLRPPSVELSLTGHIGQAMIVLLEGTAPNQQ